MLVQVATSTISSFQAIPVSVEVEANNESDKPYFAIIGLADPAIREAKERVSSALKHSGFWFPKSVLVNLAPAELKKEGSSFDLSMAIGVLVASKQLDAKLIGNKFFFGELGLNGKIRSVKGIAALVIAAIKAGFSEVFVPKENIDEASLISGINCIGVESLGELYSYLQGFLEIKNATYSQKSLEFVDNNKSFDDVAGQEIAKRALMVASVGGHNVLMSGPPGCGKSMLAERFSNILPPLSKQEILEVVQIHSVAGLSFEKYLSGLRPYRAPHYNISESGLIGGGSIPKPGEISLAHNGVLFLDEFPEYKRSAIESLRAPLENKKVLVSRVKGSAEFPANFQLIAAMNTCPCGRRGVSGSECLCSQKQVDAYIAKISQPILERIDMHIALDSVPINKIKNLNAKQENSQRTMKEQVLLAYQYSIQRNKKTNFHLSNQEVLEFISEDKSLRNLLDKLIAKKMISARGYFRMLKVARSIADLELSEKIQESHIAEAFSYSVNF